MTLVRAMRKLILLTFLVFSFSVQARCRGAFPENLEHENFKYLVKQAGPFRTVLAALLYEAPNTMNAGKLPLVNVLLHNPAEVFPVLDLPDSIKPNVEFPLFKTRAQNLAERLAVMEEIFRDDASRGQEFDPEWVTKVATYLLSDFDGTNFDAQRRITQEAKDLNELAEKILASGEEAPAEDPLLEGKRQELRAAPWSLEKLVALQILPASELPVLYGEALAYIATRLGDDSSDFLANEDVYTSFFGGLIAFLREHGEYKTRAQYAKQISQLLRQIEESEVGASGEVRGRIEVANELLH